MNTIFGRQDKPRIFAVPIGQDFLQCFVEGLSSLSEDPTGLARTEIYVNTERTLRRLKDLFELRAPTIIPKIRTITSLAFDHMEVEPPDSIEQQLALLELLKRYISLNPQIAHDAAAVDLSKSLFDLMGEMFAEGVNIDVLEKIDLQEHSDHWKSQLEFLKIAAPFWQTSEMMHPDALLRKAIETKVAKWAEKPPQHPIIVAGSTGSRGHTAELMRAICRLPQGAVILPGFDLALDQTTWDTLNPKTSELDHPQSGLAKFLHSLELHPLDIPLWKGAQKQVSRRNELVSLALRPAPVTDQWIQKANVYEQNLGPDLEDLDLILAEHEAAEASAIAVRLRQAAENDETAVLITPDKQLARRVTNHLSVWGIVPDDSAGQPFSSTPEGILLHLAARLIPREFVPQDMLSLLKHLLNFKPYQLDFLTQDIVWNFENEVLRDGPPKLYSGLEEVELSLSAEPSGPLLEWLRAAPWADNSKINSLKGWSEVHFALMEYFVPNVLETSPDADELDLVKIKDTFQRKIQNPTPVSFREYLQLLEQELENYDQRDPQIPHPKIAIWGTLEARVQGADLVILGALNETIWPRIPEPDPWISRQIRKQIGLLVPERNIGLSAHDFQQAISAKTVVLSRSLRQGAAPSVPSRWLMRMENLFTGIAPDLKVWKQLKARGDYWLDQAQLLATPDLRIEAQKRPSPVVPKDKLFNRISVTQVATLINNPYDIYASKILGLKKVKPLGKEPNHMEKGSIFHDIIHKFLEAHPNALPSSPAQRMIEFARSRLNEVAPWPSERRIFLAQFASFADWFIDQELKRRDAGKTIYAEKIGTWKHPKYPLTLSAKPDRIDRATDGSLRLFDYKTGNVNLLKGKDTRGQLELQAVMALDGAFEGVSGDVVSHLEYIGLNHRAEQSSIECSDTFLNEMQNDFDALLELYFEGSKGFTARDRPVESARFTSDYEQLSRFGEWLDSDEPNPEVLE